MTDTATGLPMPPEPAAPSYGRIPRGRAERLRGSLGDLFPEPGPAPAATLARRVLSGLAQVVAVLAGAAVLLARVPGPGPWTTVYGEDYWMFLIQAIQQPWHLFIPYNGYEQFLPRVIEELALLFPLKDAAVVFALTGAVVAAACGLFVYHASEGHIRSRPLRALLGLAVILLSVAPAEIADSGVDTPWYLLLAAFWALLWRPRTRAGIAVATLVVFLTVASNILAVLFLPLVAVRVFTLRRPRDHAVTAGWLAGCALQAYQVLFGNTSGQNRLTEKSATLGQSLAYYAHNVILPSLGWHLGWRLRDLAGLNGATAIVAIVLAVVLGGILLTQPRSRPFVITAFLTSLVFPVFSAYINGPLAVRPVTPTAAMGARYAALPVFALECAAVLGVDYLLRKRAGRNPGARRAVPRAAIAAALLVIVLGANWAADFRYPGLRSNAVWTWAPISAKWQLACEQSASGVINEYAPRSFHLLPCDNLHF